MMAIYNKQKPFKRHIAYLQNGKSRAFQFATPRHVAFVATVGSLFVEMCFHDVVHITDSCISFV